MAISEPRHLWPGAAGDGRQVQYNGLALGDGFILRRTHEVSHICGEKAEKEGQARMGHRQSSDSEHGATPGAWNKVV